MCNRIFRGYIIQALSYIQCCLVSTVTEVSHSNVKIETFSSNCQVAFGIQVVYFFKSLIMSIFWKYS
jgi:hypothetical protein